MEKPVQIMRLGLVPTEFRRSRYIFVHFRLFFNYNTGFFTIMGNNCHLLVLRTMTIQGISEMATQMDLCQEQGQVELINTGTLSG